MKVCIYLRKSRMDEEAEKNGKFETLKRHKSTLLKVASEQDLNVIDIKEEIVSGESVYHRPEMIKLLEEVESGLYDAVLVMDIDRLGRGGMQDQGLILETFKRSNTKIITPRKVYNLNDEWDEEYSEFEAFMARKELKLINRRLQRGRLKSIEEGNFIGSTPPFGYDAVYEGTKKRMLVPNKDSEIVKLIYDLYVNHGLGGEKIANKLNELGYTTQTGLKWYGKTIRDILKNKFYCGYIQWSKVKRTKSKKPNQVSEHIKKPVDEWIESEGTHEPIISLEMYNKARAIANVKQPSCATDKTLKNPFSGLLKCRDCGSTLILRVYKENERYLVCYKKCGNKSSRLEHIEDKVVDSLKDWLQGYRLSFKDTQTVSSVDILENTIKQLEKELQDLHRQKNNLHNLLEQEIYTVDTFLERSKVLADKIDTINNNIIKIKHEIEYEHKKEVAQGDIIPSLENVLELYPFLDNAKDKNKLLKGVLHKIEYKKERKQVNDDFALILYPKLPV